MSFLVDLDHDFLHIIMPIYFVLKWLSVILEYTVGENNIGALKIHFFSFSKFVYLCIFA